MRRGNERAVNEQREKTGMAAYICKNPCVKEGPRTQSGKNRSAGREVRKNLRI